MLVHDRHALVTGASRGIGEAIARELARRGAHVTVLARPSAALTALAAEIEGTVVTADLAVPEEVDDLVDKVEAVAGPVDLLVNNAGIEVTKRFVDTTEDELERIHHVNQLAPVRLTRQVLPGMIDRGRGHVVAITSMGAAGAFPGLASYAGTKAGLTHFMRVLRQDLKGLPIGLTVVQPGPVRTSLLDQVDAYAPAKRCFDRFERAHLMPKVPAEVVANATVDAVERGKAHVWLPKRVAVFPFLTALPQRIVEPLIRDIAP